MYAISSEWPRNEKEISIELASGLVFEIQKWGGGEGLRRKMNAGKGVIAPGRPEWPIPSSPGRPSPSSRPGQPTLEAWSARPGRLCRLIGTACWPNSFRWVCPSPARPFLTRSNLLPSLRRQSPEKYNRKSRPVKKSNFPAASSIPINTLNRGAWIREQLLSGLGER